MQRARSEEGGQFAKFKISPIECRPQTLKSHSPQPVHLHAHTTNPVPFIVIAEDAKQYTLKPNGSLRDISPTMLGMLGIYEPKEMTGSDLRIKNGT
jgi:bisphosphoglycerate-independent phosphoglycerate mutase (AlkP superfamily)